MILEIAIGLVGILGPAWLLVAAVRRWLDPVPWRVAGLLFVLTLTVLGRVVVTDESPLPLDAAAKGYPIRGVVGEIEVANANTSETARQILPWMAAVNTAYRAGRIPFWNRYSLSGHPLLGNGQSAPFSPFFLATAFVPLPRQLIAMAGLKVFTALLFGCLLLRREGLGWWVSILGSVLFACSLFQVVFLYYPMTSVTALLPALLYSVSRILDRPESSSTALLAVVTTAMLVSGHPESVVHASLAAVGWLALEVMAPRGHRRWSEILGPVAAAVLAGVLMASPAWLPLLEQISESSRKSQIAQPDRSGHTPRFEAREAPLLLNPNYFGHPARNTWDHRSNYAEKASFYVGLLPLTLLIPALVSPRSSRRDRLLVFGFIITLLLAFDWSPIAHFVNSTPPLSLIANARLRFVATLLAAVAAARTLHRLDRRDLPLLAASTLVIAVGWHAASQHQVEPGYSYLGAVALLGLWVGVAVQAVPRFGSIPAAAVAIPFVFFELVAANSTFHSSRDESLFAPALPIMSAIEDHAEGEGPFRVVGRQWTLLPDLATHYGLEDIRGVDPMASSAYIAVLDTTADRHPRWRNVRLIDRFPQTVLDFLNVRYVLADPGSRLPQIFEHLYSGPDGELYFNPLALPRFFVPLRLVGRGDAGLAEDLLNTRSLGRSTLIDSMETGIERRNGRASLSSINDDGFGGFQFTAEAKGPALIASSLPFVPGWRLEIDGERASIERINGAFVGFTAPAGRSEITLHYHPLTFDIGVVLALVGLAGLLFFVRYENQYSTRDTSPTVVESW